MTEITTITGDSTALYIGVAFFVVLFSIAFAILIMANYKHRSASMTWYKDQVIAFKVGYIYKVAKEKDIVLVYPPKTDLMNELEDEISKDLSAS